MATKRNGFIKVMSGDKEMLMPVMDYLDRKAWSYGFDSYDDLVDEGLSISLDESLIIYE